MVEHVGVGITLLTQTPVRHAAQAAAHGPGNIKVEFSFSFFLHQHKFEKHFVSKRKSNCL